MPIIEPKLPENDMLKEAAKKALEKVIAGGVGKVVDKLLEVVAAQVAKLPIPMPKAGNGGGGNGKSKNQRSERKAEDDGRERKQAHQRAGSAEQPGAELKEAGGGDEDSE